MKDTKIRQENISEPFVLFVSIVVNIVFVNCR
jgi:hypothetical protein